MEKNTAKLVFTEKRISKSEKPIVQKLAQQYFVIGDILFGIGAYDDALGYFYKQEQMYRQGSFNKVNDDEFLLMLHFIGGCNCVLNDPNKALKYLRKELSILKHLSVDIEKDDRIALACSKISKCYLSLCKYKEALYYSKQSLFIKHRVLKNIEIDQIFAMILCRTFFVLISMGKPDKALNFLKYFAKNLSFTSVAAYKSILFNFGQGRLNTQKVSKALSCFEMSLPMRQESSQSAIDDIIRLITFL